MMSFQRLAMAASFVSLVAAAADARKPELLPNSTGARLRRAAAAREKVSLPDLPLGRASLDTVELEPMQLWAPGAKIVVHRGGGTQPLDPPDATYFRGSVAGDPQSAVFLSVADESIRGLIVAGDRRFAIGSAKRVEKPESANDDTVGLRELEPEDDPSPGNWTCNVEGEPLRSVRSLPPKGDSTAARIRSDAGGFGATYQLRLAIETDHELYNAFNSVAGLTAYIESLVGNASVIFQRDLATTLTIGSIQIHTTPQDPWTRLPAHGTVSALAELAKIWHEDPARAAASRSAVVMVSGKTFNGGQAFIGTLCGADFACGAEGAACGDPAFANGWGGAYAFCGTNGVPTTTVPDPTTTRDGITYAMPTTNDYWMLFLFTHEVGHLASAPHTNCVQLTYEERVSYGVERAFVDECVSAVPPCFSLLPSVPAELGTIMSGCHALFDGAGRRAARYLFWEPNKPSEKMRSFLREGIDGATPDATIRLGSYSNPVEEDPQPLVCTAGRTARVATCASCTYAWTITGGAITSGASAAIVTYTPSAPVVTLGVTITNPSGCTITVSRPITTECASMAAPATLNAVANGASSVSLTWSAVAAAASYEVWRSQGPAWTAVGTTRSAAFLDLSVTGGTAYLYRVRGLDAAGAPGAFSAVDFAAAVDFTDPVLHAQATLVRAVHIAELRDAVNTVRALAGLAPAAFSDSGLAQSVIRRVHVQELRTGLAEATAALGRPAATFTDPTLSGDPIVRREHITELREALR